MFVFAKLELDYVDFIESDTHILLRNADAGILIVVGYCDICSFRLEGVTLPDGDRQAIRYSKKAPVAEVSE